MEITELLMMETDYFSSCLDWLQADQYWDDSSARSTGYSSQHLSSRSSGSGANPNPSPCNSVTNFGNFKVKGIKRIRSRASKKTPTQHLNATAKNFKQLVQKHTGRPTVPRPFTLFGVSSSSNPIKGPMTLSFGEGNANCTEHYENHYFNDCVLENEVGVMYSCSNSPVKPLSPVSGTQLSRLQPAGTATDQYASGF